MFSGKIFPYATAAVKSMETKLLTNEQIMYLADADSFDDVLKLLSDTDYNKNKKITKTNFSGIILEHISDVYKSVTELLGKHSFIDFFLYKYDFHNIKALIKSEISGKHVESILLNMGNVPLDILKEAIRERNYSKISFPEVKATDKAFDLFSKTNNPCYIDLVLDKACFSAMKRTAERINMVYLSDYVTKLIDIMNIRTYYRMTYLKISQDIFEYAFLDGGMIDLRFFINAFENSSGLKVFKETDYKILSENIPVNFFEKICDDHIMEQVKRAKYKSLTAEPVAGYVIAKECEASILKYIFSCKLNDIKKEKIKERVRKVYV